MTEEVADSYLDVILGENEWFGVGCRWTVIQPLGAEAVDVDRVVR